jgi:fluoride exporter
MPGRRSAQNERTARDGDVFRAGRPARHRRAPGVLSVVALGGGSGSVARYLVSQAVPAHLGHFPWATFLINISGCFLLGLLMVFVLDVWPPSRYLRPFLGVGFLGGYTTFSTFAVELRDLAGRGAWTLADAYALDSLAGGVAAVWGGMTLARVIAGLPLRRERKGRTS